MSAMRPFSIRRLLARDQEMFRHLLAVFGQAFEENDTYMSAQPGAAYLEALLGDDQFIALAALEGDTVIGGLAAYVLKKFERERSEIYIYDLAVVEAHRRMGVATALIEFLKPIASDCGAHVIFIQADASDGAAVALYSKFGIREDVLHFDIAPS